MQGRLALRLLSVLALCVWVAAPIAWSCTGEVEPNDEILQGDVMGSVPEDVCGMGTIYPADDVDFWAFEVTEPNLELTIETGGLYDGDTVIILFNSDGNQIAADDDSGEGTFSRIELAAQGITLPTGWYVVAVAEARSGFSSTTPYILSVMAESREEDREKRATLGDTPCDITTTVMCAVDWRLTFKTDRDGAVDDGHAGANRANGHDFRWSGNSFSLSRTEGWGDPATFSNRTEKSVSGEVSADYKTLVFLTLSEHDVTWRNGTKELETSVRLTVRNLPLSPAEGVNPCPYRYRVSGETIAAYVTEFSWYDWNVNYDEKSISLAPWLASQPEEFPDHVTVEFR